MSAKILVVDDDEMMISLITYRLKKEGYEVLIANDGQQAVELVSEENPDLIITDILMPFMSGLEFVDQLRNTLQVKAPILIISSSGHEKTVLEAFDLGANDFITKPFSPSELVVRLKKYLH